MTFDERNEMLDVLEEASQYENTEIGEYWTSLVRMGRVICHSFNDFKSHFDTELKANYDWFKENFRYEDKTYKTTRTVRELVWVDK